MDHLSAATKKPSLFLPGEKPTGWVKRHPHRHVAQHGAIDELPAEVDKGLFAIVEDKAAAVVLKLFELLSASKDLLPNWPVGIISPGAPAEILRRGAELFYFK